MENETKPSSWRAWTQFALRWGLMVIISLAVYLIRRDTGDQNLLREIGIAFVVGAAMNMLLAAVLFFPALHRALPFVSIPGDWILAAVYANLIGSDVVVSIGAASLVMIVGAFQLGIIGAIVQTLGVIVVTLLVVTVTQGAAPAVVIGNFGQPLLVLFAIAVAICAWVYMLDRVIRSQQREIEDVSAARSKQASDMRERTRAMYEMASTLSSTLSYQKILDALLDVGRLSLRTTHTQRSASAVMLFRANDNALQIATSRGMRHVDEARVTAGEAGIIGEALTQCIPIIGKDAHKDAELMYFVAFQGMRSVLCIPLRAGYNNYGVILYACEAPNAFNEEHTELLTAISTQATIALQNAVLYRNLLEEKERIIEVEEDARKKLARDLHDGPTQTISAIAMRMSYVYRLLERDPEQVPAELKKVEELARNTTKEIRNLLFGLRPLVLESQGLTAALNQLAEKMKETYGQAVAVRVGAMLSRISTAISRA
jgi:signal transduction histidine kinase